MTSENSDFKSQPELEFDPDAAASPPDEETLKAREAEQAHKFRESAFRGALFVDFFVFVAWLGLIANVPAPGSPDSAFYLWGLKSSLATATLLVLGVGTLRFAIKCYGHHHPQNTSSETDGVLPIVGRVLESVGRAISSNS